MKISEETIEAFIASIQQAATTIGEGLDEPDDDWAAMVFVMRPDADDEPEMIVMGLGVNLNVEDEKDQFTKLLPDVLRDQRAQLVAYLSSSWYVAPIVEGEGAEDWPKEMVELTTQVRPGEHPWRREGVHMMVVAPDHTSMHVAEITRDDRKVPTLGEWEKVAEGTHFAGRFYEALCQGIGREP